MNNDLCSGTLKIAGQSHRCQLPAAHSLLCRFSTVFISEDEFNEYQEYGYASEDEGVTRVLANHNLRGTISYPAKIA